MGLTPFAILVLDREPLQWSDLPGWIAEWTKFVGGLAFFGLILYVIVRGYQYATTKGGPPGMARPLLVAVLALVISAACFAAGRGIQAVEILNAPPPDPNTQREEFVRTDKLPPPSAKPPSAHAGLIEGLLTAGGAVALIGLGLPFLRDLFRLRARRIWALARLSFKEAVRRRIVWAPVVLLLIFLFPPKWFVQIKPEDEISTYVSVIYVAMPLVMLLIAGLLAAFAIPTDIRSQTIHTVVTKPVEPFEIVLGRTLGYVSLVTVILGVLSAVSIVLLWASEPSEEAKYESYKARVPVYGKLQFLDLRRPTEEYKGDSVGREWEYRSYIAGGANTPYRAIWRFESDADIRALAERPTAVPCEFSFDIFRTTKGEENKGVTCTFQFVTWKWGDPLRPDTRRLQDYLEARRGVLPYAQPTDARADKPDSDWAKLDKVAEQFGFYEYPSKEVADYHTFSINVPPGLFRAALQDRPAGTGNQPRLMVIVKCESPTQFLGAAKRDLYFLAGDQPFWLNFVKGVIGLWLQLVWVIAVAVACSTYLSGVISWLVVMFLFIVGMFQEHIAKLVAGVSVGGGPLESAVRLVTVQNIVTPLPESAGKSLLLTGDAIHRWLLARVMPIFPDVDRFSWSGYVGSGFSIPWREIGIDSLILAGYLLPWALLAYYLMKSREVANPM
jgi:ABC-type transport system involved in multi-copper enzyme maturation permease subunit